MKPSGDDILAPVGCIMSVKVLKTRAEEVNGRRNG